MLPIFLPEHYATVALHFVPTLGQTELQLDCKGIPVCKEENMKFCWQKQHFEEIKGLLTAADHLKWSNELRFYKDITFCRVHFLFKKKL